MLIMSAARLVRRAEDELAHVTSGQDPQQAFLHAHMAALRAAAAVLELQVVSGGRRRRVRSVWEQLAECGPDWQEWAGYFAQGADTRAAIESGRSVQLAPAEADELVATATDFVGLVRDAVTASARPARLAS